MALGEWATMGARLTIAFEAAEDSLAKLFNTAAGCVAATPPARCAAQPDFPRK